MPQSTLRLTTNSRFHRRRYAEAIRTAGRQHLEQ